MFRFTIDVLKDQRRVIEKVLNTFIGHIGGTSYGVEILDAEDFNSIGLDDTIISAGWETPTLSVSFIVDFVISTAFIDKGYVFSLWRSPNATNVLLITSARRCPPRHIVWTETFLAGLSISAEPCFRDLPRSRRVNVTDLIKMAFSRKEFKLQDKRRVVEPTAFFVLLNIPFNSEVQRTLYVYFQLLTGSLIDKITAWNLIPMQDSSLTIKIFVKPEHQKEIEDLFARLTVGLQLKMIPKLFHGTENADGTFQMDFNDFSDDMETMYQTFPRVSMCRMPLKFEKKMTGSLKDYRSYGLLDTLYMKGLVEEINSNERHYFLSDSDYRYLGMSPPFEDFEVTKRAKARRKISRLTAKILNKESPAELSENISNDSDSDENSADQANLVDAFAENARSIIQCKVALDMNRIALREIEEQCQPCHELLVSQQKLVIFEFYIRIKNVLSKLVPPTSSVISELRKNGSPLARVIKQMEVPGLFKAIKAAMQQLADERLSIAKPQYQGQQLFWISTALKDLFSRLLGQYQAGSPKVPAPETIQDFESIRLPANLENHHVHEIRNERQNLEEQLEESTKRLITEKSKAIKCLEAYRYHEFLVVGHVFKTCISTLRALATTDDWQSEAANSTSPIAKKMQVLGITDSLLKKMIGFVFKYRNEAAHPDPGRLNFEFSAKYLSSYITTMTFLQKHMQKLEMAISEASSHQ